MINKLFGQVIRTDVTALGLSSPQSNCTNNRNRDKSVYRYNIITVVDEAT